MKKILFITSFLLILSLAVVGQQSLKGFGIEPNLYFGSMVKHTPTMIGSPQGPSRGFTLNLSYETYGKNVWETVYNYPVIGFYSGFMNIDNGNIFGEAYFAAPYISFTKKQREKSRTYILVGMGGGYLTETYNEATNITNNAIGTHWNGAFNLRYGYEYELAKHWTFTSSVGINHFSNAGVSPKNLGINLCDAQIGIKYIPNPVQQTDFQSAPDVLPIPQKRWSIELGLYNGFEQQNTALGGAFYPVYNGSLNLGYRKSYKHRWVFGYDYEYNVKVRTFINHIHKFPEEERFREASRHMFFIGEELKVGNLSLIFNMGAYFRKNYQIERRIYNKFGLRYYILNTEHFNMHLNAVLKTELVDARYVSVGAGFQFR